MHKRYVACSKCSPSPIWGWEHHRVCKTPSARSHQSVLHLGPWRHTALSLWLHDGRELGVRMEQVWEWKQCKYGQTPSLHMCAGLGHIFSQTRSGPCYFARTYTALVPRKAVINNKSTYRFRASASFKSILYDNIFYIEWYTVPTPAYQHTGNIIRRSDTI